MKHRDLNDMMVFAAIAQAGSITDAAKKMHLPKSNVSRRLKRLEERLGHQLLERNTRISKLTTIGMRYADHCRLVVEEADAADLVIVKSEVEPAGQLRISASVLVGQQIIAPVLASYGQKFPLVQVVVDLNNSRVNLIEDGFDVAFRIGMNPDSSLISQSVGSFSMGLYASPEYLQNNATLESPDDLAKNRCLVMSNDPVPTKWILEKEKRRAAVAISGGTPATAFVTLRNLAATGGGIAMLPAYAVYSEERSGLRNSPLSIPVDGEPVVLNGL